MYKRISAELQLFEMCQTLSTESVVTWLDNTDTNGFFCMVQTIQVYDVFFHTPKLYQKRHETSEAHTHVACVAHTSSIHVRTHLKERKDLFFALMKRTSYMFSHKPQE